MNAPPRPNLRLVASREQGSAPVAPQLHETDWSILMARAQAGDEQAYRKLLHSVTPYLRSLANKSLGYSGDVEDTVQDILITIHLVRASYDPQRPFGAWLKAIAQRRIVDCLRHAGRRRRRETELADEHMDIAEETTETAARGDIEQLLRNLPPKQAAVVRLTKIDGLSSAEAAQIAGLSVAALKVTVHRALARLRRTMKQDNGHE